MKYQTKPVIKEAFELQRSYKNWPEWAIEALGDHRIITHNMGAFYENSPAEFYAEIKTLEGIHRADPGDYIIQGLKGELYLCKPDIFEMSHEPVEEKETIESFKVPTAMGSTMLGMGFR